MLLGAVSCLLKRSCWKLLGLLLFAATFNVMADESLPPLLKQSKVLACAQSASEAKTALSALWEVEGTEREFPDENMLTKSERTLHAASLDIVLKSLLDTAERFPSLRNQVERTILKWNYCDVFQDGVFYDLKRSGGAFTRQKAAESSPENWLGFKALGFLGDTDNRFVPNILDMDQQSLRSDYEWLFHRIFREQCFPHPDTSELFDSAEFALEGKTVVPVGDVVTEYPHKWDAECIYPQQAPALATKVSLEIMPLAVPELLSAVELLPVPQLVPGLLTQIKLASQTMVVPVLQSKVSIEAVSQLVPRLLTVIKLKPQTVAVPGLLTQVKLMQQPVTVPLLKAKLFFTVTAIKVPKLPSKVSFDKVKVVRKAPKKKAKVIQKVPFKNANNRGNYMGNNSGNHNFVGNRQQATIPAVVTQQVVSQPNIVLGKNASLLERVLGGLSGGGNVLIVDKIQLTVNEYNGTVETAISSSDIGSSVTTMETKPAMVKELLQALPVVRQQKLISATNTVVKPKPKSYVVVPELQSMLLVSQVEAPNRPRPVQIKRKVSRVNKSKTKTRYSANKTKRPTSKRQSNSSSLFTYKPYSAGKPSAKEKSVEQLLLEYQAYEARRKTGWRPKKKSVDNVQSRLLDVPELWTEAYWMFWPEPELEPVSLKRDVPLLKTELWVHKAAKSKLTVPSLNSKVRIYKVAKRKLTVPSLKSTVRFYKTAQRKLAVPSLKSKVRFYKNQKAKFLKVPALGTMIIQQLTNTPRSKKRSDPSFKFSNDYFEDEVFEATQIQGSSSSEQLKRPAKKLLDQVFENTLIPDATVSSVTTPTFLSGDAPLPYFIDEQFTSGVVSKTQKAKSKKSKPNKYPLGLAGNIYLKHSLRNSNSAVGGSINRKLIKDSYWSARVGWNYTLEESEDPFSYSWGVGYSDWHPGTFSAQLNNWGPIKPEEGLALEKAVANFGYSVKSEFLKKHNLSLSGAVNIPIEGNSSIAGNLRWSPIKNWYVNASVSQPLEGDGTPKWTYGFGYSDWRPNKFNLQYSNYGPNEIPYHNYEDNGTWALSYNWKF